MALSDCRGSQKFVSGNATTTEVNAGLVIIPARKGKKICIDGGFLRALGGAAAACTSVDIKDTTGTPVVAVAVAQGALTENTVMDFRATSNVTLTTKLGDALTADKAVQIQKTGSTMTTATSVDYCVFYHYVDA